MGVVKWSKINAGFDLLDRIVCYQNGLCELLSAVDHSMPDRRYFIFIADYAGPVVCNGIDNFWNRRAVIKDATFISKAFIVKFKFYKGLKLSKSFNNPTGKDIFVGHIDKLKFNWRTAAVNHQDFYIIISAHVIHTQWHWIKT